MATDSLDDLKQSILDLSGEDRDRLLRRLTREAAYDEYHASTTSAEETPLEAYCREYPEDPLCARVAGRGAMSTEAPTRRPTSPSGASETERYPSRDYRSHVRGFPSGGGCVEAWEFLSAMRGGH